MARPAPGLCHKPLIVKSLGDLTFPLRSRDPPIATINDPLKENPDVHLTVLTLSFFFSTFLIHTNNIHRNWQKVKNLFKFFLIS